MACEVSRDGWLLDPGWMGGSGQWGQLGPVVDIVGGIGGLDSSGSVWCHCLMERAGRACRLT
eukprot:11323469-Karenia_brevis.AAC.1